MTKLIDLSVTVSLKHHLKRMPQIDYYRHEDTPKLYAESHGLKPEDYPEGIYCANERVCMWSHDTTHVDAPWHYYPTSEGKPAKTIDQVPLEWCYGDGVVLDFHHKKKGERIDVKEIEEALNKIDYKLKPLDIVLVRTDVYKRYGEPGWEDLHPGVTRDGTLWLINHGIKMVGIDAWGWDIPHDVMAAELKAGIKGRFWESHLVGKEREYCQIEKMANLDKIPKPFGFKVAVFPVKVEGASAGFTRAVAIID